jgi:thymidylate kinase
MQIELIGCTGAGKSTLLDGILRACRELGIDASSGDDYVLKKAHLNWIGGYLPRTLLVDLISLTICLLAWRKYSGFYRLASKIIFSLPVELGWFEKLNIARNTLKKIGIHEIVHLYGSDEQIVLMDEGTLNTANCLFVHLSTELPAADFSNFVTLVPMPDAAIYLRQDEEILVERTLARGHKRIRGGSRAAVEHFIKRAVSTFDGLVAHSAIASRVVEVDSNQHVRVLHEDQVFFTQVMTLKVLRAGLDLVRTESSFRFRSTPALGMPD